MFFSQLESKYRPLMVCVAALALTACGQRDAPAPEAPAEPAAEAEAQRPAKVPVTTASDEARSHYEEGLALADNLHAFEANAAFKRAVEADPDFAMGWLQVAFSSNSNADFFDAVGRAQAAAGGASDGEQLYITALTAISQNDQAGQLNALNDLVALYPQDERVHIALGNYYNGQQDFAAAAQHFGHATEINPQFANAFNSLGYAHRSAGDLEAARAAFERYIELIPDEANPYDSYAELLMEIGEYDASIENYRKAIELDASFPSAYAGISINESLKGNAEAAQSAAAEMLAAAQSPAQVRGALFRSVTSHLFAGDMEAAMTVAGEIYAAAEAEGDHGAMGGIAEYMGDIMAVSGDGAAAQEHYDNAVAHRRQADINDANKAQAERTHLFKSAVAAVVADDLETARTLADEYRAAAEANGTRFERQRIHEIEGYILFSTDPAAAAAELAQANQQDPIVLYWSAFAQNEIGNTEEAETLATKAAYRNTLSGNLPFFRDEAIALLEELDKS